MDTITAREIRKLQQRIGRVEPKAPGEGASSGGNVSLKVLARMTSDMVVASSTQDIINFNTVDYDPGGDVTTGASWHYDVPDTGFYTVAMSSGLVHPTGNDWAILDTAEIDVFVNGSFAKIMDYDTARITDQGLNLSVNGEATVSVTAGDTIDVEYANGSSFDRTLVAPVSITIMRVA